MALLRVVAVLCVAWPLLLASSMAITASLPRGDLLVDAPPTQLALYDRCQEWTTYLGTVRRDCRRSKRRHGLT